jgi:hypothetical protein
MKCEIVNFSQAYDVYHPHLWQTGSEGVQAGTFGQLIVKFWTFFTAKRPQKRPQAGTGQQP